MSGVASPLLDALDRGWHFATLFFGETQIRTGHVLVGALNRPRICGARSGHVEECGKITGRRR